MSKQNFIFFILIFFTTTIFARIDKKVNVIPENDWKNVQNEVKKMDSVSESDFLHITKVLHRLFAQKIKDKGQVDFVMNADWNDDTVNAYATREIDTWTVHIAGGIARAEGMTKESLALVVCHEIGHHLGGAPRTFLFDGWPSAEGQADYWATSKCLKKYYEDQKHLNINAIFPEKIQNDCRNYYSSVREIAICQKSQLATIHFSQFLNALPGAKAPTSIDVTDTRQVKGTNTNNYPRPQCRIDTLYAGALCTIEPDALTSDVDERLGHCNDVNKSGTRPRCWYNPK